MAARPWNPAYNHDSIYTLCTRTQGRLASGQPACAFDVASYFKWAFVRNPWDRLVSAYEFASDIYLIRRTGDRFYNRQPCPFNDLIRYMWDNRNIFDDRTNFAIDDLQKKPSFKLNGFERTTLVPQHLFLQIDGHIAMDFIGRFENLEPDFTYVCRYLGQESRLPHFNKIARRHYRDYYTEETRNMVADIYARDIELFEYEFDTGSRLSAVGSAVGCTTTPSPDGRRAACGGAVWSHNV